MNVPAPSARAIRKEIASTTYTTSSDIQVDLAFTCRFRFIDYSFLMQVSVLDEAKQAHPNAQWWIKADGCDVVEALGESVHHVWSGDEDLNDGEVARQHSQYIQRLEHISSLCRNLLLQLTDREQ